MCLCVYVCRTHFLVVYCVHWPMHTLYWKSVIFDKILYTNEINTKAKLGHTLQKDEVKQNSLDFLLSLVARWRINLYWPIRIIHTGWFQSSKNPKQNQRYTEWKFERKSRLI